MYYLLTILLFSLLFLFRSNYVRLLVFAFYFPLLYMATLAEGGEGERIMRYFERYYQSFYVEGFWIYYFSSVCFTIPLLFVRKKLVKRQLLTLSPPLYCGVFTLFLFFVIVSYPWIFRLTTTRFQALLPGSAWNSFYIITFLILYIAYEKRYRALMGAAMLASLIIVFGGERADSVLIVALSAVALVGVEMDTAEKRQFRLGNKVVRNVLIGILGMSVFFLMVAVGKHRVGGEFGIGSFVSAIVAQDTAVDAVHVWYSAMWYVDVMGYTPATMMHLLYSFLPFHPLSGGGSPLVPSKILKPIMDNVSGGLWIVSPYMSGGTVLTMVFAAALGLLFALILKRRGQLASAILLLIVLFGPRMAMYGVFYIYKPAMIAVVFVGCLVWLSKKEGVRKNAATKSGRSKALANS